MRTLLALSLFLQFFLSPAWATETSHNGLDSRTEKTISKKSSSKKDVKKKRKKYTKKKRYKKKRRKKRSQKKRSKKTSRKKKSKKKRSLKKNTRRQRLVKKNKPKNKRVKTKSLDKKLPKNKVVLKNNMAQPVLALERSKNRLSTQIFKLSNNIDRFFSNKHAGAEENNSQMRIGLLVTIEDLEKPLNTFIINTRIRLPMTEKRFQLFLDSFDNEDTTAAQDESRLGLGLRYEFLRKKHYNLQTDAGVRLSGRLDPFIKVRLRNSLYSTHWETRFVQTLYWFESVNYEFQSELFFDRSINFALMFRIYNSAKWSEFEKLVNFNHSYNLIHTFDKNNSLIYKIGLEGVDKPVTFVENYTANLSLRTLIYQDWLFLSMSPGVVFRKIDGFKTRPQIMFRLDMIAGKGAY